MARFDWLDLLRYTVFPRRCTFCGRVVDPERELCVRCADTPCRILPPICFACGKSKKDCDCGGGHSRFITALAAPFYYAGELRIAIHRMKFKGQKQVAELLAREMASFARQVYWGVHFDAVTFVPMTDKEQRERGFNQSRLLAEGVAKALDLECAALLVKIFETRRQHALPSRERSGNLLGAFDVCGRDAVAGKRILLCDDLSTTHSTLTECAKMLKLYGAREVFCLTACVSVFPVR